MVTVQPMSMDEEVFWDCQEDSLSYVSLDGEDSIKERDSTSNSGSSGGDTESSTSDGDGDELQPNLQDFAFDELGETSELRQSTLNELRSWLMEQSHLRGCCREGAPLRLDIPGFDSDNFLLRFLRFKKFNVRKAAKMMDQYLAMRCHNPHWFMDLDPTNNTNIQELVDLGYVFVLPERDSEGRRVIFNYAHVLDPARHSSVDIMKTFMATFETLLADPENQIRGFTYILYCKGLTLGHCSVWTPLDAATMFTSCEKNLPIRHRSINLMNLPFAMWAVFEFAKSFLSHKIRSRISNISDNEKLQERFGCDILPKEFGGKIPMAEMTAAWKQELIANKTRLEALDGLVVSKDTEGSQDGTSGDLAKERRGFWSYFSGASRS